MKNYRIEAIILTIGLSLMGLFIHFGLASFSAKDRVVSVRGLAEREMKADRVKLARCIQNYRQRPTNHLHTAKQRK